MSMQRLDGPRLPPAAGGAAKQLVVFLHGYGADGNDLIGLGREWSRLLPHAAFVAPNAPDPFDMAPFGYQWFSLQDRRPAALLRGVQAAAPLLEAFLDEELTRHGLDACSLALVGFSQGTMLSLHVAPRRPSAVAAVLGFSGALVGSAVSDTTVSYVGTHPVDQVYVSDNLDVGVKVGGKIKLHAIEGDPDHVYFYANNRAWIVDKASGKIVASPGFLVSERAVAYVKAHPTTSVTIDGDIGPGFKLTSKAKIAAVPDAASARFDVVPPGTWLLKQVPWTEAEHRIRAVPASNGTAALLDIDQGAPCLVIERVTWRSGTPVTSVRLTYPGDRHELTARFNPARGKRGQAP